VERRANDANVLQQHAADVILPQYQAQIQQGGVIGNTGRSAFSGAVSQRRQELLQATRLHVAQLARSHVYEDVLESTTQDITAYLQGAPNNSAGG